MADNRQDELEPILKAQRAAFTSARPERLEMRRDRIKRAMQLLEENAGDLCAAMSADFGNRSPYQSMMTDITGTVNFGKYCLKNLDDWAKPDRRKVQFPLGILGARAEVRYEPKGVVGIMSPWNFPVNLSFGPLMQVLAAGNRASSNQASSPRRPALSRRNWWRNISGQKKSRSSMAGLRWRMPSRHCLSTTWFSQARRRRGAR